MIVPANRLTDREALELLKNASLPELGSLAHRMRLRMNGPARVTYVVDRSVNYTNVCVAGCHFCAFHCAPGDPRSYTLTVEEVCDKVKELAEVGGTQLLMQGGLNPDLRLDYHVMVLSTLRSRFPKVTLHVLSPVEIHFLSVLEKADYRTILEKLREAGMDSLPGGGAEILVDSIRERLGSKKCSSGAWLAVMKTAHEMGIRTTATMMFGHVESLSDRVEHLRRIRDLQDETGGFTAFIPWTYQPGNTKLGGRTVGGVEYLKTLAVSRLYLDNVPHIQASWLTQGLRIGELALRFGADDFGGTLLEENVVRSTGLSVSSSEEELRRVIRRAGFLPSKRDTQYNCLERLAGRNE